MKKSKKLAILATVLGLGLGTANADAAKLLGVVTTDASYQAGKISFISGSRVTTDVNLNATKDYVVDLNRDASLYPFIYNGNGMLALRQYTYSTVDLAPTRILDGNGNWNNPTYSGIFPSVANMHAAASYKDFIFGTGYDLGKIGVQRVQDNGTTTEVYSVDLKQLLNEHCGASLTDSSDVHGESLGVKDGKLYINASINPYGGYGTYSNSYLLQFSIQPDGTLQYESYARTAKNPDNVRMNFYNNNIFVTGIGGSQGYGSNNGDSGISRVEISGGKLVNVSGANKIKVPSSIKSNGLDFRNMKILPNGTAYILMYVLGGAGATSDTKVYKTTVSNLLSANPQDWDLLMDEGTDGYFNNIDADYYTKRVYMECGNTVRIYTDGQVNPLVWRTENLTDDLSFVNFNGWAVVPADQVAGALAVGSDLHATNIKQKTLVQADYRNKITGTSLDNEDSTAKRNYADATSDFKTYTFNSDKTIFTYSDLLGDLTTNVAAAVSACDGNNINIQAGNNTLQLQSLNYVGNPTGIYAGYGKNVTVDAGKLNILTIGAENGNSLTNAIWLDAPAEGTSSITINAPVDISMRGGLGGNAIAVQKTDRLGESSKEAASSSSITINGDVSVLGADSSSWGINCNKENVFSRFNSSGIYADVNKSKVTINGNVDFTVYGNGITTNAKDSNVTVNGGGSIVVPKGMKYGYYTLGAYLGTINMNMGANGTVEGSNTVKLQGDIFALNTGKINLGLTTGSSYLNGIIDNGGTVNLSLKNGAVWTNEANNTRYAEDNEDVGFGQKSRVTKLTGGATKAEAGVIKQSSASKNLLIDNYSGNITVVYQHDSAKPTTILGGNVTISKAAANSVITLRTDYDSNMKTNAVIIGVLNSLANKLFYTAYTNGERNLAGVAEIAEGLTASSATKYYGNISYNSTNGQGRFTGTEPEIPEKPAKTDVYNYSGDLKAIDGNSVELDGFVNTEGSLIADAADIIISNDVNVKKNVSATNGAVVQLGGALKAGGAVKADQGIIKVQREAVLGGAFRAENNSKAEFLKGVKADGAFIVDNSKTAVKGSFKALGSVQANNGGQLEISGTDAKNNSVSGIMTAKGAGSIIKADVKGENSISGLYETDDQGSITLSLQQGAELKGRVQGNINVDLNESTWKVQKAYANRVEQLNAVNALVDMTSTSSDLEIGKYSGSATVIYAHDAQKPEQILGGDLVIKKASADSQVTLQTDNNGVNTSDTAAVKAVLSGLAQKLNYTGYADGERNLTGYVKLAEGLTAQSAAIATGNISYDSTGRGEYADAPAKTLARSRMLAKAASNSQTAASPVVQENTTEPVLAETVTNAAYPEQQVDSSAKDEEKPVLKRVAEKNLEPNYVAAAVDFKDKDVVYGASETAAMRGAKSALVSSVLVFRSEANDLMKRMGDLRLAEEENGVWAKYYGGKYEYAAQNTNAKLSYNAYQLGYDKKTGHGWTLGGAVSYNEGNSGLGNGKAELKNTSLGLYGTWNDAKGQYVDLIAKSSWLRNDFKVFTDGHKVNDDYKAHGLSFSAEYGKRFENKQGAFAEPSLELTYSRINDFSLNAKSDYVDASGTNRYLGINQDSFDSLVGRLGLRVGKKSANSSIYAKLALAHEFAGDLNATFSAIGEPTKKTQVDFKDTWGELQVGGTLKLGKAGLLYADYQRNFVGDVKEKYRIDAGMRWSF